METKYHLILQSGPDSGSDFLLEKPELILGRDPNADLVIADPEVSRRHARLVLSGAQYAIEDLGSTNGTFVRGIQIHEMTSLHSGDIIAIGERVVLLYEEKVFDPDATMAVPAKVRLIPEAGTGEAVPAFGQPAQSDVTPSPEPQQAPVTPAAQASNPVPPMLVTPPFVQEEGLEIETSMEGQVPAQPPVEKKHSAWRGIILIIVLLILIFCVIPWIIIDITNSYCLFLPGILNAIQPGVCP